jgi:hypothetical protein
VGFLRRKPEHRREAVRRLYGKKRFERSTDELMALLRT